MMKGHQYRKTSKNYDIYDFLVLSPCLFYSILSVLRDPVFPTVQLISTLVHFLPRKWSNVLLLFVKKFQNFPFRFSLLLQKCPTISLSIAFNYEGRSKLRYAFRVISLTYLFGTFVKASIKTIKKGLCVHYTRVKSAETTKYTSFGQWPIYWFQNSLMVLRSLVTTKQV